MNKETNSQFSLELINLVIANAVTWEDYELCQTLLESENIPVSNETKVIMEDL